MVKYKRHTLDNYDGNRLHKDTNWTEQIIVSSMMLNTYVLQLKTEHECC